jgi:starch synthase
MKPLRVLSVASEVFPLVKTGGLADVTGALPGALEPEGVAVRTLIPGYPAVTGAIAGARAVHHIPDLFDGPARVLETRAAGLDLLVLDAPHLYARPGNPYLEPEGSDWPYNASRFAALAMVAAEIGGGAIAGYVPDVVHAHDWQAGLAPAYLHYRNEARAGQNRSEARADQSRSEARADQSRSEARADQSRSEARAGQDRNEAHAGRRHRGTRSGQKQDSARPGTVMTVHNLAFPGKLPAGLLARLGLPPAAYAVDGVEFYGTISMLKAGLQFADRITTVSPTYAAEIRTAEAGMGFDGLLRARSDVLSGILNGIDTTIWDPASDKHLAARFDRATLGKRARNKVALQARMGLAADPAAPLFAVVSRLTWQKGMDLLLACLPSLLALGGQLALVGSGEPALEAAFQAQAAAAPTRIGCVIGYDEALAHAIQAGADALLVPSRFEPCGLTQMCALRYGAVPVVARVGGLADTVIDANPAAVAAGVATGVQFAPATAEMLQVALRRTVALYRQPAAWRTMQENGMAADVSWHGPARSYAALYRELVSARA